MKKNAAEYINQDSGVVEYYTPIEVIEAARSTMGSIDLDPASSAKANQVVGALCYFTQDFDGLAWDWFGNVWMNHPFSREGNPRWINKLVSEYEKQNVVEACCITYASTSETWLRPLYRFPLCFLSPRTNYRLPSGEIYRGVTKGSVVAYLGSDVGRFTRNFTHLGSVCVPVAYLEQVEASYDITVE